jgi:hypothetical protein
MSPIRLNNLNKRLSNSTGGTGGFIGTSRTPWITLSSPLTATLGCEDCGRGTNTGIFKSQESYCGIKCGCNIPYCDFGGRLICNAANVRWIVANSSTEVCRSWTNRNDAITTAQQESGVSGWFIPSSVQLVNPCGCCRLFWQFGNNRYWSNTQQGSKPNAVRIYSAVYVSNNCYSSWCYRVRAFRCVSY